MTSLQAAKKSPWRTFGTWVGDHPRLSASLSVTMLLIAAGILSAAWILQPQATASTPLKPQKSITPNDVALAPKKLRAALTGAEVADEATSKRVVTAIMIENSPSARPQSGLKDAGIVFEAVAEGGITRLLTLHQEDKPQTIGPVRSLRPYYIDWLAPFNPAVAHVGGSANALKTIRNGSFRDIDQFFNAGAYWRARDRAAPHNVYTSFDKLDALNKSKNYTSSEFTPFPRKTDSAAAQPTASKVNIEVSSALYNVGYDYDKTSNSYARNLGGSPHNDREAGRITAKTVVAIKVPVSIGLEDGYREQMKTTGHNQAVVFQDGIAIEGYWRKKDQKSQMEFYDKNGVPIAFNNGPLWITVIAPQKKISWQ